MMRPIRFPLPASKAALAAATFFTAALLSAGLATAEEAAPLTLTVHPSGYERTGETIEEKIARRERQSAYLFRSICRNCMRSDLVEIGGAFNPQERLDAAQGRRAGAIASAEIAPPTDMASNPTALAGPRP